MKLIGFVLGSILVVALIIVIVLSRQQGQKERQSIQREQTMKIESPVFGNNQLMPAKYTCDGQNVNPPLTFSDVPEGTRSLVLIVDDPDAPMGTWIHWTVWNIDPKITEIKENTTPIGAVEGMTSFGKPGYGGPCPPSGTHRYLFKLYALNTTLSLESSSDKSELKMAMSSHILAQAELIGLYRKGGN